MRPSMASYQLIGFVEVGEIDIILRSAYINLNNDTLS